MSWFLLPISSRQIDECSPRLTSRSESRRKDEENKSSVKKSAFHLYNSTLGVVASTAHTNCPLTHFKEFAFWRQNESCKQYLLDAWRMMPDADCVLPYEVMFSNKNWMIGFFQSGMHWCHLLPRICVGSRPPSVVHTWVGVGVLTLGDTAHRIGIS